MDENIQDGAPKIAKLPYFSGFMVDITIVNRAYFMVYKPTYNWGGPILYHLQLQMSYLFCGFP